MTANFWVKEDTGRNLAPPHKGHSPIFLKRKNPTLNFNLKTRSRRRPKRDLDISIVMSLPLLFEWTTNPHTIVKKRMYRFCNWCTNVIFCFCNFGTINTEDWRASLLAHDFPTEISVWQLSLFEEIAAIKALLSQKPTQN